MSDELGKDNKSMTRVKSVEDINTHVNVEIKDLANELRKRNALLKSELKLNTRLNPST